VKRPRGRPTDLQPSRAAIYKRIQRRNAALAQRDPAEVMAEVYEFGELFVEIMHDHMLLRHPKKVAEGQRQTMKKFLKRLDQQYEIKREAEERIAEIRREVEVQLNKLWELPDDVDKTER
jgi:hypothetical protein